MALRPDPLDQPLGRHLRDEAPGSHDGASPSRAGKGLTILGWGAAGLAMSGFVAVVAMTEPKAPGGRPRAVATIETVAPPPRPPAPAQTAAAATTDGGAQVGATGSRTAADYEAASGVRVHRGGAGAPNALIIEVPQSASAQPTLALNPAPDPRLTEKGPHGPLPKVGPDGARASEVYARPIFTSGALKPGAPRIALYVGGLGLAAGPTREAIALPPAVTLAFAPYGATLARDAAAAREAGHEILLQAPMEPMNYPAVDPGQNTLLASDPGKNLDRLHWLMSRFSGYVGVANYMGARFLNDEAAAAPALREIGRRGLFFVEDLPADGSAVSALAGPAGVTALRADVVIDRSDAPEAVAASLSRLEVVARERGSAIGVANALPNTLEATRKWATGLEARGVALAPLSSMAVSLPLAPAAPLARRDGPKR